MKKTVSILLCLALLFSAAPVSAAFETPSVSARSYILFHPKSGTVLCGRDEHSRMLIASTTKVMTALVVLENCDPSEKVTVSSEHCAVEGSSMYLSAGGDYTVEELLYGLLLASGNDAASALAEHAAGSESEFAVMMNARAESLGLENTHFENPHGLDGTEHYSCAADMARIMAAALEQPLFIQISGSLSHTVGSLTYRNHNRLLRECPGVIAGKTGYTKAAGRTLVSCCERDGMRLVCVTLDASDDWDDHAALYERAFSSYTDSDVLSCGGTLSVALVSGLPGSVNIAPAEPLRVFREKDAAVTLRLYLPRFVHAPVQAGEAAGRAAAFIDGESVGETRLVYTRSEESIEPDSGLLGRLLKNAGDIFKYSGYYADNRRTADEAKTAKTHIHGRSHLPARL